VITGRAPTTESSTRRTSPDDGFSLIEVLIAISLIGLVIVPLLQAVSTSIVASSTSRSAAQVETALVNAADRVNRAPIHCDYSVYAQAAVQTQWGPDAADRVTLTQYYYEPGANATQAGTWVEGLAGTPACKIGTPTDGLVQKVRLSITSPDNKVTRTIEVVKSDV
jgi:prepilin-type N-terminal cleavage/methylation domain-containing protein